MEDQEFAKLQAALKASEDALKAALAEQSVEIKSHGETAGETAKKISAAEGRLDQVVADLKGLTDETVAKLTEELTEAKSRVEELEKAGQRPGWPGSNADPEELKSPGERFTTGEETTASLKAFADNRSERVTMAAKSLFASFEAKANFLSDAATRLVVPQRTDIISPVLRRLRIRDLLPVRPTSSNAVEYLEEIGFAQTGSPDATQTHGAAAPAAEAAALAEAQLKMDLKTANVQDIGHWIPASRQILNDMGQLRSYIDDRLIYGVGYAEETQLLYGDGTSPNLQGFMTHASRQNYAWSSGIVGDTKIDAMRKAATLAHVREYMPTGAVMNPSDWEDVELAKGDDKHYIWFTVASGTEERLFRLPIVVTNAIMAADALVGSFGIGATLWDREQANVRISEHHQDFFTKRLVAILAEERLALTIYRPDAFVDVDFDSAPV